MEKRVGHESMERSGEMATSGKKGFAFPRASVRRIAVVGVMSFSLVVSALAAGSAFAGDRNPVLAQLEDAFTSVAEEASPAVVSIRVEKKVPAQGILNPFGGAPNSLGDDFLRRFFEGGSPHSAPQERIVTGEGSGFLVSKDGYIVTNNHVAGDADRVVVTLNDGRKFDAKVVGTDPLSDVAVIKVDGKDLPTLPLGDSDSLKVGEMVVAVGNPFGLSQTITTGVVSALGRNAVGIADYEDFIQTDAAINPGNSGGPLLDLDGRVIGVNTAIYSRTGGAMGIGFAIPINMAKLIRDQLLENGKVVRGYLGVYIQDLTPELAGTFHVDTNNGVLISQVQEDTPAEKAGILQGDVIVAMNGRAIRNAGAFRNSVAMTEPGTEVTMKVLRDGKERKIDVTIGKLPAGAAGSAATESSEQIDRMGITVEKLTGDVAEQLGYVGETGVVVTEVASGSVADLAGIRAGMLIEEVNRTKVESAAAFRKAVDKTADDGRVLLLLRDGKASRYVVLEF
jgi:serine protease Do